MSEQRPNLAFEQDAAKVRRLSTYVGRFLFLRRPKCYHLTMIDWSSCSDVERDPDRVGGAWVFRGTRVPVAALFENLEEDASVHQFIEWFPGVSLSQARHVLEHAARSTLLAA